MQHTLQPGSVAQANQIADLIEALHEEGSLAPLEIGNRMLESWSRQMGRLPRVQRDQVLQSDRVTLTVGGRDHLVSKELAGRLDTLVTAAAKWSREDGVDYSQPVVRAIRAVSRILGRGSEVGLAILRDSPGGSIVEISADGWPGVPIPTQVAFLTLRAFGLSDGQLGSWEDDPITLSL